MTVTPWSADVWPTTMSPKSGGVVTVNWFATPDPVRFTVCWLPSAESSSLTVSVPGSLPADVGLNVTPTVHWSPVLFSVVPVQVSFVFP